MDQIPSAEMIIEPGNRYERADDEPRTVVGVFGDAVFYRIKGDDALEPRVMELAAFRQWAAGE
jgi:hypothetical protein